MGGSWETSAGILSAPSARQGYVLLEVARVTQGTYVSTPTAPSHTQRAVETEEATLGEARGLGVPPRHSSSPLTLGSVIVNLE